MKLRRAWLCWLMACASLPTLTPGAHGAPAPRRSVILILSDDHRHDFMGCAEGPEMKRGPARRIL